MFRQMQKLIELLDEYEKIDYHIVHHKIKEGEVYRSIGNLNEWTPIWWYSKSFGFIKWLVDNDKIGDNKNSDRYTMMKLMRAEINEGTEVFEGTERYEFVIMILSIQDEPIEFLVSILK